MKRTPKQPTNINVTRLFDKVASHCKSKRAKIVLKQIVKKPEMAMLSSMSGLMANYLDPHQTEVNILVYQARQKDIFDHGRWLILIAYLLDNTDLKINVWLNPAKDVEDETTELRPVIDFIVDNFHQGKVKTHIVQSEFRELVDHIGLEKLDLVYNHNASAEDHNTPDSRDALQDCIQAGVRYVISDPTPVNLLFKMTFFEIWGISTSDSIYANPYFVPIQKGISSQYRYMGYSISLDTLLDEPDFIDSDTRDVLNKMASSIIQCTNVGESLRDVPYIKDGVVHVFKGTVYNPSTQVATSSNSGDKVSISLPDMADFPLSAPTTEISLDVARVAWGLMLYSRFQTEFERLMKLRKVAIV